MVTILFITVIIIFILFIIGIFAGKKLGHLIANYLLSKQWFIAFVIQRFFNDDDINKASRDYENTADMSTTYGQIVSEGKYHGFRKGVKHIKNKLNAV